eukprot:1193968-Prorocentrum_minimum.AAC.5
MLRRVARAPIQPGIDVSTETDAYREHALYITIPDHHMSLMSHPKATAGCHLRVASHALRIAYAWSLMSSQVLNVTPRRYDGGV